MSKLELSIDVLEKNLGKILNQDQLYSLLDHSDWLKKWEKKYKIVYYLRLRGYLFPLKRNLFLVTSPEKKWTEDQILSLYYWEVLAKMGKDLWWNKRYIWGLKALEIRLWDYDIRDEILLVNGEAQGVELVMLDKIAQLKSYNNKKKKSLISDLY